jgi:hypothetical protein
MGYEPVRSNVRGLRVDLDTPEDLTSVDGEVASFHAEQSWHDGTDAPTQQVRDPTSRPGNLEATGSSCRARPKVNAGRKGPNVEDA